MNYEEIKECFNAPALSAMFVTRAFLADMIQQAKKQRNSFFIISNAQSPAAHAPWPGATVCIFFFAYIG